MKAAVWYGQKDVRVEDREPKVLQDNEVKVKVSWAGICGTDLHEYLEGPIFISTDKPDPFLGQQAPVTLGHEFAGVVDEVGANVTKFKKGDRVVVNPTVSNREKEENIDLYDGYSFIGLGSDGGFAEFTNAPEENVYKLPDQVSDKEGALVEPTAVAVQAIKEGEVLFGDTVAIFGAGPIGLLTIIAAKAAGASKIFVFDLSDERLKKAREVGATHTVNSGEENPNDVIRNNTNAGVDVAFEVAGVASTLKDSIEVTRARGTVVIVSIFGHAIEWNPMQLTNSGVKLTSTIAYTPTTFQQTIDLINEGNLNVKDVITDEIDLEDIVQNGFEQLVNDKSQAKILVKLS
ncbi:2,3-butanediol dehydrogenase [Staphylococcus simiae]|uniref:2,3-butanediol dehydrogenase n=1 Tax=Staphylococcus simiae TaxID=308354 RepID=UPI001A97627F|nr:2,3-butanediol dehydrogenase [Staphylococcus simiae]MBO1199645.1 2,3-butanediol dehydrogenase [Staphylococcus simiae]MBO1202301.1 2,3-butanediol dehydrogenase [Staphylococcus simiae]MBO1204558.1 2,3-butanediol dehydrogenase [Staphylococcus simiae]MBO1211701.1 2,3-butanediol dehydrogenase [Staphylococcus simiae]MBO1230725.1 2,3-butanediol dehydrogenase [Staphylococcus simiae]